MVNDAYSFPVLSTMVKTKVYVKPNMSETTSYVKLGSHINFKYSFICKDFINMLDPSSNRI